MAESPKYNHFEIDEENWEKAQAWVRERRREAEEAGDPHCSVGSEVTYSFTPTSLGLITVVFWMRGTEKEQQLDLTDWDNW